MNDYNYHIYQSFLSVALSTLLLTGVVGCHGGEENVASTAEIVSVNPTAGYPGDVETTVTFKIETEAADNQVQWIVKFGDGTQVAGGGKEGVAKHIYQSVGNFTISVEPTVNKVEGKSATFPYTVYTPVDLQAMQVVASPANVSAGDTLAVDATLKNNAAVALQTPVKIDFFLTTDISSNGSNPSQLIPLGQLEISDTTGTGIVIAPGAQRTTAHNFTVPSNITSGIYYAAMRLNTDSAITDTDHTNNFFVGKRPISILGVDNNRIDLALTNLVVAPDRSFAELNSVNVAFQIANHSTVDAFDIIYKIYLSMGDNTLDETTDTLIKTSPKLEFGPHQTKQIGPEEVVLAKPIIPTTDEEVWVIVVAEAPDVYKEEALANNKIIAAHPIIVTNKSVTGPDVAVKSFRVTPSNTYILGPLKITATIENEGSQDVSSFFCGVYLTNNPDVAPQTDRRLANINIPRLATSETLTLTRDVVVPPLYQPGEYYSYIVCDPLKALGEPFRSNNQKLQLDKITIAADANVDLSVESITFPDTISDDSSVDVQVRVCASGSTPAAGTTGKFFATAGNSVDFSAAPLTEFEIPPLASNTCDDITIPVTVKCLDFKNTMSFGVEIDPDNVIPEQIETNNRKSSEQSINISGSYCSCLEEASEGGNDRANTASAAPTSPLNGAICKARNCDFYKVELVDNASLQVDFTQDLDRGAMELKIFSPDGVTQLDAVQSQGNGVQTSRAGIYNVVAGEYLIQVCGIGNSRNYYTINYQVLPQPPTPDLILASAEVNLVGEVSIGGSVEVSSDIHNIGEKASGDFSVTYWLSPDTTFGDTNDIKLGSTPVTSIDAAKFTTLTYDAKIPVTIADGKYYIAVQVDDADQVTEALETNNLLWTREITVKTTCYDPLEPNNTLSKAADLTPGTYSNLLICSSHNDYYKVCVGNAKSLNVTLSFDDSQGDLDLELYSETQSLLTSASGVTGVERVSVDYVNGAQCYYIGVLYVNSSVDELEYSIKIEEKDLPVDQVCTSDFEPNNDFKKATPLTQALTHNMEIDRCPVNDFDIYFIELAVGQHVTFSASKSPATQPGTLRMQLFKPDLLPAKYAETGPGLPTAEIQDYVAPVTGRYYLQISFTGTQRRATYTLGAQGIGGVDLKPLDFSIGYGTYHPNEEVRFSFNLENLLSSESTGATYKIFLSQDSTLDPTDTEVAHGTLPNLPGSSSLHTGGQFTIPAGTPAGNATLFLKIEDAADSQNDNNVAQTPILIEP